MPRVRHQVIRTVYLRGSHEKFQTELESTYAAVVSEAPPGARVDLAQLSHALSVENVAVHWSAVMCFDVTYDED